MLRIVVGGPTLEFEKKNKPTQKERLIRKSKQ
jgi:hypothetical protein